jgi:hypothetical protein
MTGNMDGLNRHAEEQSFQSGGFGSDCGRSSRPLVWAGTSRPPISSLISSIAVFGSCQIEGSRTTASQQSAASMVLEPVDGRSSAIALEPSAVNELVEQRAQLQALLEAQPPGGVPFVFRNTLAKLYQHLLAA